MATKRFDDVAEKARALEAQVKKLRREAVRTMCRKVSVLAGLPFEKKQLKKIDTQ